MSDDMVRCSACGTPHGSIEDATVCCEKDKPGVVGRLPTDIRFWDRMREGRAREQARARRTAYLKRQPSVPLPIPAEREQKARLPLRCREEADE